MTSDNLPDQEPKQELIAGDFGISPEFIEENRKLNIDKPRKKKFAPFTKAERTRRRKEVYRLHFELGVPAIRIAEMMKVDKNTINNDIQLLYQELRKDTDIEFDDYFNKQITRLESQRSRVIRYLDEAPDVATKLMIERQLTDIDFRLLASAEKIEHNAFKFHDQLLQEFNKQAEKQKLNCRFHSLYEAFKVSEKGHDAILDILKNERVVEE
jgi:hypothetical protein